MEEYVKISLCQLLSWILLELWVRRNNYAPFSNSICHSCQEWTALVTQLFNHYLSSSVAFLTYGSYVNYSTVEKSCETHSILYIPCYILLFYWDISLLLLGASWTSHMFCQKASGLWNTKKFTDIWNQLSSIILPHLMLFAGLSLNYLTIKQVSGPMQMCLHTYCIKTKSHAIILANLKVNLKYDFEVDYALFWAYKFLAIASGISLLCSVFFSIEQLFKYNSLYKQDFLVIVSVLIIR